MMKPQKFYAMLKDKNVAFIGTGVSHNELIRQFLQKGIRVTVCDKKDDEHFDQTLLAELTAKGAAFALGENYLTEAAKCDVIFRTPGMYYNHPELTRARQNGVAVTSEMEVFFDLCPCKIYAVTGSDGKTTTTTLISEMLKADGRRVHIGGNIGKALLPIVETMSENDAAVVELSSFQLISMRRSPDTAVITNISPNHLDVHGTMEEYIAAKCNIIDHQNAFSRTVFNADCEAVMKLAPRVRGRLYTFSRREMPQRGAFLRADGMLCFCENGEITEILHRDSIKIPGIHNVENYLTAISALWGEVEPDVFRKIAREFGGVEHRIEFVRELDGVKWYNNAIATSPTRVIACLNSFAQKQIMIAGGYDKKIPFEPMADLVNEKVKLLILMGATAEKIEKAVTESEQYPASGLKILHVKDMPEAVAAAHKYSESGDIVTLSPACASFDMYPIFEAKGRHFKELVNAL